MKRNYGLKELPQDDRDFALGKMVILPELEDLTKNLELPFIVKDQGGTDYCSAYASCATSEVQEGLELEPAYSFAVSKKISGNKDSWGQDLRSAMKAHLEGALPADVSRYNIKNQKDSFLRDIKNWGNLEVVTFIHRKKTFFSVSGPYDAFDNIRATLSKTRTPVVIGIQFGYRLSEIYLNKVKEGFGHAMTVIGYTKHEDGTDVLIVGNSYGDKAGHMGKHYITREVINYWVKRYGAYTFVDISKEEAQKNLERGITVDDNLFTRLIKTLTNWLRTMVK